MLWKLIISAKARSRLWLETTISAGLFCCPKSFCPSYFLRICPMFLCGPLRIMMPPKPAVDSTTLRRPKVTLPASEVSDTFPVNVPQNGQKVKVRVLSKEKGTVVTMREGSLERPEKENVQVRMGLAAIGLVRFCVLLPTQVSEPGIGALRSLHHTIIRCSTFWRFLTCFSTFYYLT